MDAEFASNLRERCPPERKYLVGVSGGRDSMALWHFLRGAGYEDLVICHLNHQLRGSDSEADAKFVRDTAESWQCEALVGVTEVGVLAEARKLSIEAAAREARHAFFAEAAAKFACPDIFLAHHADDQVETALINLCRGSGLRGLAGMPTESDITVGRTQLRLIRPLLEFWRSDIDAYVQFHGIDFREDATNAESAGSNRNRIRHELIPLMGEIFDRDVRPAIRRTSRMAADEDEAVESMVEELWPRLISSDEKGLDAGALAVMSVAFQRHVLYRWLRNEPELPACRFRDVEAIRGILSPRAEKAKVNLPGGWHARRNRGRIFLQPPAKG